jgi:hypothetical protein
MTTVNSANLVNRINEAVDAKTLDVLADLANLEQQVDAALKTALDAANQRIQQATVRVAETFGRNLVTVQQNVDRMVSEAISSLVHDIGNQVDAVTRCYTSAPLAEPTPAEPEEYLAVPLPESLLVEKDPEAIATPTVAAHAIEAQAVGVLPDDDDEQEDDQDGIEDSALMPEDGIPTTRDPDGLHTRKGEGNQSRYSPAECPELGQVYFRRVGRRWQPVRYGF